MPAAGAADRHFLRAKEHLYFNGEAVELLHLPDAHTGGDIIVHFRKSDVIAAGDVYINTTFPVIDREQGGSLPAFMPR